jgi:hypothetical protein
MEVMGVAITILGLILAYIWKSNGRMQMTTMEALSRIEEGQREMGRTLIEGQKDITAGQKEIARMVSEGLKSLAEIVAPESKLTREEIRESR